MRKIGGASRQYKAADEQAALFVRRARLRLLVLRLRLGALNLLEVHIVNFIRIFVMVRHVRRPRIRKVAVGLGSREIDHHQACLVVFFPLVRRDAD